MPFAGRSALYINTAVPACPPQQGTRIQAGFRRNRYECIVTTAGERTCSRNPKGKRAGSGTGGTRAIHRVIVLDTCKIIIRRCNVKNLLPADSLTRCVKFLNRKPHEQGPLSYAAVPCVRQGTANVSE